jgi:imidazole glycerol-phosphate synthase subunit HisH
MSKNVVIIDYQLGNLFSVKQACEHLGYKAIISSDPVDLKSADFAILPGVGAFKDAMINLEKLELKKAIYDYIESGKPFMGVCLGLQLLLTESEEFGNTKGLGIIPGKVRKFPVQQINEQTYKVPQIQWNNILAPCSWEGTPLQSCKTGDYVYFVHSFYAQPDDENYVLSKTVYGNMEYCSAVLKNNVFATQFHPEKSGEYGVNIYKEWFLQNQ